MKRLADGLQIDWIVIPMNFLQQMLMAIDKSIMSTAALFTFRADLGLVGQDYSWANSVVFFGIIAGMFVSPVVLRHRDPVADREIAPSLVVPEIPCRLGV